MAGWWRWERWGEGQSGICFLTSCLPKARIYDSQAWCKESCDYFLFQNLETRASLALGSQFTALDYITVRTYCGEGWRGGNEIAEEGSTFLLSSPHTWEDSTQLWGKKEMILQWRWAKRWGTAEDVTPGLTYCVLIPKRSNSGCFFFCCFFFCKDMGLHGQRQLPLEMSLIRQ